MPGPRHGETVDRLDVHGEPTGTRSAIRCVRHGDHARGWRPRGADAHAGRLAGAATPDHACQAMLYPIDADCQAIFLRICVFLKGEPPLIRIGPVARPEPADYRRGQLAFDAAPPRWVWAHTLRVQLAGAVRVALRAEPMGRVVASACGSTLLGGCWQTVLVRSFDDVSADNRARSDETRPRVALATAMV